MAEERGKARKSLVDLIVGEFEFDTNKVDKITNPKAGGYMIAADNVETKYDFIKAKENRLREEKELLVHRELHPLFHKTEEELRNYYDTKMAKRGGRTEKEIEGVGRLEYTSRARR